MLFYAWPLPGVTVVQPPSCLKFVLPMGSLLLLICSGKEYVAMRASTSVVSTLGHGRCTLAIAVHLSSACINSVFVILKFNHTHLNMAVSKQASKQADIYTHVCNTVPLVWGPLRPTPITKCLNIELILVSFGVCFRP